MTSDALGPCSVLLKKGKRESPGKEGCLKHSNRVIINGSFYRVMLCIRGGDNRATENARHEFAAPTCKGGNCGTRKCRTNLQEWKMRDMKMRDQIAGVENAGKVSMESQSVKKCLKVVVFVC